MQTNPDHQPTVDHDGDDGGGSDSELVRHADVLAEAENPLAPLARVLARQEGGT